MPKPRKPRSRQRKVWKGPKRVKMRPKELWMPRGKKLWLRSKERRNRFLTGVRTDTETKDIIPTENGDVLIERMDYSIAQN
jgi:hypothetical protein